MANPYAPGPLAGGAERLVGALLGGGASQEDARRKAQLGMYQEQGAQADLQRKMAEAMMETEKRQAKQRYRDNLIAEGWSPQSASTASDMVIGGDGASLDNVQKYNLRGNALTAMLGQPDRYTPENANLIALQGKPVESVDIDGDMIVVDQYGTAPALDLTPKGVANVGAINARAGASNAQAQAALIRAMNPGRGRSGGGSDGRSRRAGRAPTLANMPPGDARPTREDTERLFSDPKLFKSDFIRDFGTDAYVAAMQYRPKYERLDKMDQKGEAPPVMPARPKDRVPGTYYYTPKGVMRWTKQGWDTVR